MTKQNLRMDKSITLIITIIAIFLTISFFLYQSYNVELPEEDLVFSFHFIENATNIESLSIELDFVDDVMRFKSKLYPNGTGIILDSGSRGFSESDTYCNEDLFLELKNGRGQGLTWHDKQPVSFTEYGEVEFIEITKTCKITNLVPNGQFTVHLFGENQSKRISINKIPFTLLFYSNEYHCDDSCITSEEFIEKSTKTERGITIITLEGNNVDTRQMDFDINTIGVNIEEIEKLFTIFIQVGIGVVIAIILFILSRKQQIRIETVLEQLTDLGIKQQEIIEEQHKILAHQTNVAQQRSDYAYYACLTQLGILSPVLNKLSKGITEEELERNDVGETINFDWFKISQEYVQSLETTLNQFSIAIEPSIIHGIHNIANLVRTKNKNERDYLTEINMIKSLLIQIERISGLDRGDPGIFYPGLDGKRKRAL